MPSERPEVELKFHALEAHPGVGLVTDMGSPLDEGAAVRQHRLPHVHVKDRKSVV